jgi:hypothetical protein
VPSEDATCKRTRLFWSVQTVPSPHTGVRKRRKKKTKKKIAMPHLIFGEDTLVEAPAPPFTAPHRLLSSSGMN